MDIVLVFVIGLCVGSFLNVLADRLPVGENIIWGRSHCDYCKKPLRWYELIPVVSYVLQGGKCLRCHKPLAIQYPLVELATALGFTYLYIFHNNPFYGFLSLTIVYSSLLVIFVSDLKYQIIPDSMVVFGSLGAIPLIVLSPIPTQSLLVHVLSAAGSFAFIYLLWAITRGRGMGFGDVKLAILMGLLLGYPDIIIAYYVAFLTGATVGVILILGKKVGWKSKIAFGPFLVAGTVVAFLWGQQILTWWYRFI